MPMVYLNWSVCRPWSALPDGASYKTPSDTHLFNPFDEGQFVIRAPPELFNHPWPAYNDLPLIERRDLESRVLELIIGPNSNDCCLQRCQVSALRHPTEQSISYLLIPLVYNFPPIEHKVQRGVIRKSRRGGSSDCGDLVELCRN